MPCADMEVGNSACSRVEFASKRQVLHGQEATPQRLVDRRDQQDRAGSARAVPTPQGHRAQIPNLAPLGEQASD